MNCQEFEARLNELLDERAPLELDGALGSHARCCLECRETWSGYREMAQSLRFRDAPRPADSLGQRIVSAVLADQAGAPHASLVDVSVRRRSRSRRRQISWGVGSAAAALLIALVCWPFLPERLGASPRNDGPVATVDGANSSHAETVEQAAIADVAENAAKGLAREVRSDLSDVLALVPPVEQTPAGILLGGDAATPEVAAQVRESLRPVTHSTYAAFTSLFSAAPRVNLPRSESPRGNHSETEKSVTPVRGEL